MAIRAGTAMVALAAGMALAMPGRANDPMQEAVSGAMLDGSAWRAVLAGDSPLLADDGVTIAFADDRVSGRSGCNRFTGGYAAGVLPPDAPGAPLAFGPLAGTRMACPGRADEVEALVLPALARVDGFLLDASGRLLLLSDTEIVLVARPADPA